MSATKSGVVYFRLADSFGQLMTDLAREYAWDECDENKAIVSLMESMPDLTPDIIRQIIQGKKRLKTNEDHTTVKLVDDNWSPPDFKEIEKEIDEVLAYVDSPGYGDKPYSGHSYFWTLSEKIQIELHGIARDIIEMKKHNIWKAKDLARMLKSVADDRMRANSEEFREAEEQSKYGHSRKASERASSDVISELESENLARIATSDLPEEEKRRLLTVSLGQSRARKGETKIFIDKEFKFDTAWVSPEGIYYGCHPGEHIALSELLAEKFYSPGVSNLERFLEEKGWLKCSNQHWHFVESPTKKQADTVMEWSMKWGKDGQIYWYGVWRKVTEIEELR